MSKYTPTDDEVDTAATSFMWELAKSSPDEYADAPEFVDYHAVCDAYSRWRDGVVRRAEANALRSAADFLFEVRGYYQDYNDEAASINIHRDDAEAVATWLHDRACKIEAQP